PSWERPVTGAPPLSAPVHRLRSGHALRLRAALTKKRADSPGRLRRQRLYAIAERGDRLIAATAAVFDLPLITRDPDIAAAAWILVGLLITPCRCRPLIRY